MRTCRRAFGTALRGPTGYRHGVTILSCRVDTLGPPRMWAGLAVASTRRISGAFLVTCGIICGRPALDCNEIGDTSWT